MHNFLCQTDYIFTKIFEVHEVFVAKCSNTSILYTTDALKILLDKNRF